MTKRKSNQQSFVILFQIVLHTTIVSNISGVFASVNKHPECVMRVLFDFEGALRFTKTEKAQQEWMEQYNRRQRQDELLNKDNVILDQERRTNAQGQDMEQEEKEKEDTQRLKEHTEKESCPYKILGVAKDASQADVKKAYRALSLKYHPDKNPGCQHSKTMFTKLVDAYEILGDADRRMLHDEEGFGEYQSRPHHYNSQQGFYSGNSFVTTLNTTEFERRVNCHHSQPSSPSSSSEENCSPWMIEFYTPWCVYCKDMIPDWKRAASTMDGTETPLGFVKFGAINCETERALCKRVAVRSYPEIHLYAHDVHGQEHVERYPSNTPRSSESLIQFAEKGIRLVHESSLQPITRFLMERNVTNSTSTGLWIILFEDSAASCVHCESLKASIRRMSANIRGLANFGILDCHLEPQTCREQYVMGNPYPVLKMYPHHPGSKGTGETLYQPQLGAVDSHLILPVVEKVIRMCITNNPDTENNQLMNTLHNDEESPLQDDEPHIQYQYPQQDRQIRYVLPAGVRASGGGGAQYIGRG